MNIIIISSVFTPKTIASARTNLLSFRIYAEKKYCKSYHQLPQQTCRKNLPRLLSSIIQTRNQTPTGYVIIRCYSSLSPNSTMISRLLENITFGLFSSLAILFSKKPDVIYSNTWPIFAHGLTNLAAAFGIYQS